MDARAHAIERRARELAGGIHVHGAIPARFWREAIEEHIADLVLENHDPTAATGRHGRGCGCTPCQAEDWDAIDANMNAGRP